MDASLPPTYAGQRSKCSNYFSERNIRLIHCGSAMSDSHVLTVEEYDKWYTIYVIDPTGKVEPLPDNYYHQWYEQTKTEAFVNHIPGPTFCEWLERTVPQYEWDEVALDAIHGRFSRGL